MVMTVIILRKIRSSERAVPDDLSTIDETRRALPRIAAALACSMDASLNPVRVRTPPLRRVQFQQGRQKLADADRNCSNLSVESISH